MKFLADENVPKRIVKRLRAEGHDVTYVIEENRSLKDISILQVALDQGAIILTLDKDYRYHTLVEKRASLGVIWLRVFVMAREEETERVAQVISAYGERLLNHFTTIYPTNVETEPLEKEEG